MNKDHVETTHERKRFEQRSQVVDAVLAGNHPSDVSRMFKVPIRTVYHWLALFRESHYEGLKEGRRSGRPPKLTGEMIQWVFNTVCESDPTQHKFEFFLWTLAIVRALIFQKFNVDLSISRISRLLSKFGLSPQRPKLRGRSRNPEEIEAFLNESYPRIAQKAKRQGAIIFFVDESSIRTDQLRRTTWGARGKTPIIAGFGGRHSYRCISAVAANGHFFFQVFEGSMNADRFVDFLADLSCDVDRPIIVITDNVSYHSAESVKSFVNDTDGEIALEFLPKYAPEMNPDELVWAHLKHHVAKIMIHTKKHLCSAINQILDSLRATPGNVKAFFAEADTKYAR